MATQNYALLILVFINFSKVFSTNNNFFHFQGSFHFPKEFEQPFDMDTSKAVVVSTWSPVKNVVATKERVVVENDGNELTIKLNEISSSAFVTGGPFLDKKYQFSHIYIKWAHDYRSQPVARFDGREGPSVLVILNFFNSNYGSFNKSVEFDDGIALIAVPVDAEGHIPNPRFKPFADILEQITAPNSKYYTDYQAAASWLSFSAPYYFSHQVNVYSERGHYKATVVITRRTPKMWISIDQFGLFLKLKNFNFEQLDGTSDDCRPDPHSKLIQGYSVKQIKL